MFVLMLPFALQYLGPPFNRYESVANFIFLHLFGRPHYTVMCICKLGMSNRDVVYVNADPFALRHLGPPYCKRK